MATARGGEGEGHTPTTHHPPPPGGPKPCGCWPALQQKQHPENEIFKCLVTAKVDPSFIQINL